ncbi:MAG: bacteriohemerythrin [Actinomycetota bacterium]
MARIDWTDDFKMGLPAIDADHRQLLDIANEFFDAAEGSAPAGQLADIMERLIARTREHFKAEEQLLDRHHYPHLVTHRAEHERLITHAQTLHGKLAVAGAAEDGQRFAIETADYLKHWLIDHIRHDDKPYRRFVMRLT